MKLFIIYSLILISKISLYFSKSSSTNKKSQRSVGKVSDLVRKILQKSQEKAIKENRPEVTPLLFYSTAVQNEDNDVFGIINELNGDYNVFLKELKIKLNEETKELLKNPTPSNNQKGVPYSDNMWKILYNANSYTKYTEEDVISFDHIVAASVHDFQIENLFKKSNLDTISLSNKILDSRNTLKQEIEKVKKEQTVSNIPPEIQKFVINMTERAINNEYKQTIGREHIIDHMKNVLNKKDKANLVLVGEPGVGKTQLVEGLALLVSKGEIVSLKGKTILAVDFSGLMQKTAFRGDLENKVHVLLNYLQSNDGKDVILFLDEIHLYLNSGKVEGSPDIANLLKPFLTSPSSHVIGATTEKEYNILGNDIAFQRRFLKIPVPAPTKEETLLILRGAKSIYEEYHKIKIEDEALQKAIEIAIKFSPNSRLPDSPLDLIDTTCATVKNNMLEEPFEIKSLKNKITNLEIQIKGLQNSKKQQDIELVDNLKKEKADLKTKLTPMIVGYKNEKKLVEQLIEARSKYNHLEDDHKNALSINDQENAGKIKYTLIPDVLNEISNIELKLNQLRKGADKTWISDSVTALRVAQTAANQLDLPLNLLSKSEKQRIFELKDKLLSKVIGQDHVVTRLYYEMIKNQFNIRNQEKPIAAWIFAGSTGVGKTLLARELAKALYGDERRLVRIDCSVLMEKHSATSKLIGAPPGYVGHGDSAILTDPVRNLVSCIVLFDEFEKGATEVQNILLQILDYGNITDSVGRNVSFRQTIIILTTNLGSDNLELLDLNDEAQFPVQFKRASAKVIDQIKKTYSHEFCQRFTEFIVFSPLKPANLYIIINQYFEKAKELFNNNNILFEWDQQVPQAMAKRVANPQDGARNLENVYSNGIMNPIFTILPQMNSDNKIIINVKLTETGDKIEIKIMEGEMVKGRFRPIPGTEKVRVVNMPNLKSV